MEHRCSRRVPLNINALVYKHGAPVATHQKWQLPRSSKPITSTCASCKNLKILLGQRIKGNQRCRISALVVRKCSFGIGLELEALEDQGARPLKKFIEQRQLDQHRVNRDLLADTAARAARADEEPEEPLGFSPAQVQHQ